MKLIDKLSAALVCTLFVLSLSGTEAQTALLNTDLLTIHGDYTLTYSVERLDTRSSEIKKLMDDEYIQATEKSLFQNAMHRPLRPGEDIPTSIRQEAEKWVGNHDDNVRPMLLTISSRGNKFLYKLMTTQSDPVAARQADGWPSEVMVYDGAKSSHINLATQQTDIYDGFDGRDLSFLPLFSARLGDIPVFKTLSETGASRVAGDVFSAGNGVNGSRIIYTPAQILFAMADAVPRIVEMTTNWPSGGVQFKTTTTKFTKFKNVWLPAKSIREHDLDYPKGTACPLDNTIYTLVDTKDSALEDSAFKIETYLGRRAPVRDNRSNANNGGRSVSFLYNGVGDFDVVERDALLAQKENALMIEHGRGPQRTFTGLYSLLTLSCGAGGLYLWRKSRRA